MSVPKKIKDVLIEYLSETTDELRRIAKKQGGRQILAEVANRPDDVEIAIDRVGEKVLAKILKKHKLKAVVFSEPREREIGSQAEPEIYGSLDPFDGTVLYLKGFEENWYTCLSFYNKKGEPLATGIADVLNKTFYITGEKGNYILKYGQKRAIFPSQRKSTADKNFVLASFVMSSVYSKKFFDVFGNLLNNLSPKALFYPNGGSFIYAYLAAGIVDVYIMFDEPRSEIDPGFPIAQRAGCKIVSVEPNGSYQDYKFLPDKRDEKVGLLIAAATPQLVEQLVNHYLKYASKS
jgi:fructose-1,6-bisphosphatase/inositol monophosphatase family enzyme